MVSGQLFSFVQGEKYFQQENFVFLFKRQCKSIDDTGKEQETMKDGCQ